ncbi:glycosyltransferase family 2 protein [Schwartzia succinivorans]|jgi:glycosyltransferase involved in cell wall biosynthesis|uniref:glycosyltransferase family 2 protein n=1 Tax=Schwartzia succinivorans TaxID=55507 RepID=UPI0023575A21|nr:glycosyltransferase family 2 protein [Schwartzia succinivorans]
MDALVSIVIPVYNLKTYLKKCIDSARNQSYRNVEIILVDDGSTDGSGSICDYYAGIDSRIRVIHKENGGLVSARKAGLAISKGKYIVPLDADDWIESDMLMSMINVMEKRDIDFAQCGLMWEYFDGTRIDANDLLAEGEYDLTQKESTLYKNLFTKETDLTVNGIRLNICSCIFKRELMLKAQVLIDDDLANGEDDACFFAAMLQTEKFYKFEHAYYHSMVRGGSMSRSRQMFDMKQVFVIENIVRPVLKRHKFAEVLEPMFNRYLFNLFNTYSKWFWKHGYERLYLFDSAKLPPNSRIVIYGAGAVGQSYYLGLSDKYSVAAWIDKKKNFVHGKKIDRIEVLKNISYDHVVIAVKEKKTAEEIRQELIQLGVDAGQIVWEEPKVSKWAFYVSDRT